MPLSRDDFCPLIKEKCRQLNCNFFTHIRGTDPTSGELVDEYKCAINWMPLLMIENSQQQRQTGAAVESFRNEMVDANKMSQRVLLAAAQLVVDPTKEKLIGGNSCG